MSSTIEDLALIRDHIINPDFLHDPESTQPDMEKGSSSFYGAKNIRKDTAESFDSEPLIWGESSYLANSQGPTTTFDGNMPGPVLNYGDSLKALKPVRRRPDGAASILHG